MNISPFKNNPNSRKNFYKQVDSLVNFMIEEGLYFLQDVATLISNPSKDEFIHDLKIIESLNDDLEFEHKNCFLKIKEYLIEMYSKTNIIRNLRGAFLELFGFKLTLRRFNCPDYCCFEICCNYFEKDCYVEFKKMDGYKIRSSKTVDIYAFVDFMNYGEFYECKISDFGITFEEILNLFEINQKIGGNCLTGVMTLADSRTMKSKIIDVIEKSGSQFPLEMIEIIGRDELIYY